MGTKVSVVVPTYNSGEGIDACVGSVLDQTMPAADYEVLLVDDGSTDGTAERLAAIARRHSHVRLLTSPGSGGPGGPRNLGIDSASGDYVYFLDHDDRLGPEALVRLYAAATRNGSDIVVGKLVGHGRAIPDELFAASKDRADIVEDHLLRLLTPHKLFRTAFLREHGLRFPEGRQWLEDHLFVVPAYFRADVISVLADYACCHWMKRERGRNLSARPFDAAAYYRAVDAVLDVVDAHTTPGVRRDRMYAQWFASKTLRVIARRSRFGLPLRPAQVRAYVEARRLARRRFGPGVESWLPTGLRPQARLLERGAYRSMLRIAEAQRGMGSAPHLARVTFDGERLGIEVRGQLTYAGGEAVRFRRDNDRLLWEPPIRLPDVVSRDVLDVTDAVDAARLTVHARHRECGAEFPLPTRAEVALEPVVGTAGVVRLVLSGDATIDVESGLLGEPLQPGIWDLFLRIDACGWSARRRIGQGTVPPRLPAHRRVPAARGPRVVRPYWTGAGNLSLLLS